MTTEEFQRQSRIEARAQELFTEACANAAGGNANDWRPGIGNLSAMVEEAYRKAWEEEGHFFNGGSL